MLLPTSVILACAALLGSIVEAQRPSSVTVTSFPNNKRCRGASSTKTVAPGKACQSFAGGANSYFVNRDSETCVLITYSDAACTTQVTRRELEHDIGDDDEDCERLPQKVQSFKIRCGVDDHGGDDKMLLSRIARHGRDDNHPDDHGRHHGHDDHGHDDHGRHDGHDDHGRHHGHDDHGRHHGHDDHGRHHGGDDHGHDDHGGSGPGRV